MKMVRFTQAMVALALITVTARKVALALSYGGIPLAILKDSASILIFSLNSESMLGVIQEFRGKWSESYISFSSLTRPILAHNGLNNLIE